MKNFIMLFIILLGLPACADLLHSDSYISPERYAVNETDMQIDYSRIPPAPKLNIDNLDDMRFNVPNIVEKDIQIGAQETSEVVETDSPKVKKSKKEKQVDEEAYKKRLSYKFAKWWVDQRYKREEPHHGSLHEIKVQKRINYEKKLEEELNKKEQAE